MILSTNKKIWIILGITLLICLLCIAILFYFSALFIVLILGYVIILISEKIHHKFHKILDKIKIKETNLVRSFFGVLVIAIWIILIYVLIAFTIRDISKTTTYMAEQNISIKQAYTDKAEVFLGNEITNLVQQTNFLDKIKDFIISSGTSITKNIISFIAIAVIIIPLMFSFYFKQRKKFMKNIFNIIPNKFEKGVKTIVDETSLKLKNYVFAKILESTIITIICAIGFKLAGLTGWLVFAIVCGILNIIPYLGPWIGAIPPLLISLLSPINSTFIITILTILVAQLIDNFYIIPFLIPKQVSIHPLISIILIIIGSKLYGPLGMLMAIPSYVVIKIILTGLYRELALIYDPDCIQCKKKLDLHRK